MDNYNQQYAQYKPVEASFSTADVRKFLLHVYNWMTMGLAVTGVVAFGVSFSDTLLRFIVMNPFIFYGLMVAQLIVVIAMSAAINKMPSVVAIGAFFLYAFLTGLTFSVIFLVYTSSSIAYTFIICAAMFGSVSVFGYITKMNLAGVGSFMMMGLFGLIIASVVNLFLQSSMLYWMISYVGVLIFVGLTAWDTQKIKRMAQATSFETEEGKKYAIMGALTLYLDFINMFLLLLRIMGSRR
ncbi:MAG: Bax inhibitor-1/YccA family protein [Ignavibacteriae bacterium]|nr:Bax inhibitor-1/YccA family protein [Ignavibacteriota bacterium]